MNPVGGYTPCDAYQDFPGLEAETCAEKRNRHNLPEVVCHSLSAECLRGLSGIEGQLSTSHQLT